MKRILAWFRRSPPAPPALYQLWLPPNGGGVTMTVHFLEGRRGGVRMPNTWPNSSIIVMPGHPVLIEIEQLYKGGPLVIKARRP